VGGNTPIRADFRVIAATNQNLEQLIRERRFRKDLYYRFNVISLHIPPLRERPRDIMPLVNHFLQRIGEDSLFQDIRLSDRAKHALMHHDWPGNGREVSNVLERALASLSGSMLRLRDLPFYLQDVQRPASAGRPSSIREIQAAAEKEAIVDALKASGNNKAAAARLLGIHRTLLYKKMRKYDMAP
jgi:transcriptional regulator with PAS, ATPase and Fis domain